MTHSLTLKKNKLRISPLINCLLINPFKQLSLINHFITTSFFPTKQKHAKEQEHFYTTLLSTLKTKKQLKQIHSKLLVSGLQKNGYIITKFINISANLGEIRYARELFDRFTDPYVHLWNAIIRCYSMYNLFNEAIYIYSRMRIFGVKPDCFTFPVLMKACNEFSMGRIVHGQILRHGYGFDVFLGNGLVASYAKCGEIMKAKAVFDGLFDRTIVSWTCIISGYAQNGQPIEALKFFGEMKRFGVKPDWIVLVSVLRAYTDIEELEQGKSIHGCVIKLGLENEPDLRIGLTSMYAKCGQVMVAKTLFSEMEVPNVIQWNVMISGYAKNGLPEEAVDLFRDMISKNIRPDDVTVRSAIVAFSQVGSLEQAMWMDNYVRNSVYRDTSFVCSALIDMYAKCGSVEFARAVFNRTLDKDVVVWSAMIVGYGFHGYGKEAINIFCLMKQAHVCPNDVTFIGLLTACNHSGLVQEGWEFFHSIKEYGIVPRHQHYACVVDLLGRSGHVDQAFDFIKDMEIEPGVTIWGALLTACTTYRHVELGEYAAERLFLLDPLNVGHYIQLSNLYASKRIWGGVSKVRALLKERGLTKDTGYSMVEISGKIQAFRMGDESHPRTKEIYLELERLERKLKEAGFVPDNCLLQ